jgi:hypothetical protein
MPAPNGLHPVNLSDLGLKPLSVSELKDLHPISVADVLRQAREGGGMFPPPAPVAMSLEGALNAKVKNPRIQNSSQQVESPNFLGTENPVKGKRRKAKAEIFSGSEIPTGLNALPPDPPEWIFETDVGPAGELKQRYAPIPARVLSDRRVRGVTLLVLAGLVAHCSRLGICYPGQHRLAALLRITQPMVSRAIKVLINAGYVVKLVPFGRKRPGAWRRGNRYFVRTLPNESLPPKEMAAFKI